MVPISFGSVFNELIMSIRIISDRLHPFFNANSSTLINNSSLILTAIALIVSLYIDVFKTYTQLLIEKRKGPHFFW